MALDAETRNVSRNVVQMTLIVWLHCMVWWYVTEAFSAICAGNCERLVVVAQARGPRFYS